MSSVVSSNRATVGSSTPSSKHAAARARATYTTATQVLEKYSQGQLPLTAANLASYTGSLATISRAYSGPAEVEKLRHAARSLGFELPVQAEREVMQRYQQPDPMRRFNQDKDQTRKDVLSQEWRTLTEQDLLAAEIEAEIVAIDKRQQARQAETACA